jgi:Mrp family chromosome partitioning ATPase
VTSGRVAVLGGDEVRAAVTLLGFEDAEVDRAQVAVVDARDRDVLARAAALPPALPRLTIVAREDQGFFAALGMDPARVVTSVEPAVIGPALVALMPAAPRGATRVITITGSRGGLGRTLLAANLAQRVAKRLRVCAIDATGTGALAWWLRVSPKPWSEIEAVADELSAEQLALVADAERDGPRVIGGALVAPSQAALTAVVRVASGAHDLVIADAPVACDPLARGLLELSDRRVILAYDDPWSALLLETATVGERDWLIASQSKARTVADHATFRALPRDESSVAAAIAARAPAGGALGRAYDELAELLAIDATDA